MQNGNRRSYRINMSGRMDSDIPYQFRTSKVEKMQQVLEIIGNAVKILAPALIALYFIVVGLKRAWQGAKEFWVYRKLIHYDQEGAISRFFERLANLPPETVPGVLSQVLLPADSALYLEQLVREH